MRFPRMTTRRWMVVVAILGVAIGAVVEARRLYDLSKRYQRVAADASQCRRVFGIMVLVEEKEQKRLSVRIDELDAAIASANGNRSSVKEAVEERNSLKASEQEHRDDAEKFRTVIDFFARRRARYEYAASHPWETLPADPIFPPAARARLLAQGWRELTDPPKPTSWPLPIVADQLGPN